MRWYAASRWRRRTALIWATVLSGSIAASGGEAQVAADSASPAGHGEALVTRSDAWVLGGFAIAATVAFPNDRHLASSFRRGDVQDNRTLRDAAALFRGVGQPGVVVGGVSAWALGRLTHRPVLAATGLRVTEAIVVAAGLTSVGKFAAGRARPATTDDRDPYDFRWWRGTRQGYTSMPSGHTSAAFAAASALAGDWRRFAPGSARYAVPALYSGAALVGLSRMYHDGHWASDVVVGAALGALSGRVVGRWGRAHADNRVQRWLAPVALHSSGGEGLGVGLSFVREW